MECLDLRPRHSSLMFAARITLPHITVYSETNSANSPGVLLNTA
jgi:hypothetical protein